MLIYPFKVSKITQFVLGGFIWRINEGEKKIYLTFDDGPVPEASLWVLRQLEQYNAKATFFCVGHNIDKHPRVYQRILKAGHLTANHTYNHLSGLSVSTDEYLENVWKAEKLIGTRIFRPPYGKINPMEYLSLKKDFKLVLCDVLSGDFDKSKNADTLREKTLRNAQDGSIILFHDSIKAIPRISDILPVFLRTFTEKGYTFCTLPYGKVD
ncbi:MAG: polysaccharide deacetylase family protein [Flavobacteriales bacterium]|nr:polysaccharide deacetylase family protein [Flavobacteriales bacterium]